MNETVDKLLEELRPLAEKMGQGAEFLWEVSYRQAIVSGVIYLLIAFILLLIMVAAFFFARYSENNDINYEDGFAYFLWGGFCFLISIPFFALIVDGLRRILNPGYYAIEELFNVLPF